MSNAVRYLLVEVVSEEHDMRVVIERLKKHLVNLDGVQIRPVLTLGATSNGLSDITHFFGAGASDS